MEGARLRGYLGLGSNVGDRLGSLRAARDALAGHPEIEVTRSSSVYETEPQGEVPDQPDFLNAALAIQTPLGPEELLAACKGLERALGREPGARRQGPRTIDIDVLLLDALEHRSPRMTLPHPGIADRRFVLVPLLELDPALRLPDGTDLRRALERVQGQRVERVGEL